MNNPTLPQQTEQQRRKKLLFWGVFCLVAPSVLFILGIILGLVSSIALSNTAAVEVEGELFASHSSQPIINSIIFLLGALSVLTWLPGIIIGVILLVKRQG